jgi:hypothetical protein
LQPSFAADNTELDSLSVGSGWAFRLKSPALPVYCTMRMHQTQTHLLRPLNRNPDSSLAEAVNLPLEKFCGMRPSAGSRLPTLISRARWTIAIPSWKRNEPSDNYSTRS